MVVSTCFMKTRRYINQINLPYTISLINLLWSFIFLENINNTIDKDGWKKSLTIAKIHICSCLSKTYLSKAVMFVSMSYALEPNVSVGGLENAGIRTYINMDLFNKDAKKVFKLDEYATEKLLDDLNKKLPKITKKVDKKL